MESQAKSNKGLKRLRVKTSKQPTQSCKNCGKERYSPCHCLTGKGRNKGGKSHGS